ncbi:hypothetical protein [Streptomyces fulvoviolaceus]|uniref:hypothetical protein n=1 Tax=Streptomyces fulvoviolaceus TaxID=285535 RepID=UPI0021C08462|nr:hypothetical protein [Streptomyces fulvoviolaceus]MCT9076932.1 hypothetical protein [Streptomyces fulvoviolaceus]
MTSPPLEPLQLDTNQVRTAADFHESYARFALRQAERSDDGMAAFIESASAYRLAGQWRLLVDPDGARDLLLQAARLLTRAELTYGAYLEASLAPDRVGRDQRGEWVDRLLRTGGRPFAERGSGSEEPRPGGPLDHVQQQTYLLLACAALTTPGSEAAAVLRSFAARSPHREGVVPMGSMAMPVRTFWGLALDMLSAEDESAARSYAGTLAEMSRAYDRTVDLAMANTRTWFNAAAPIDVADLDVIGTMAMGVQRFGPGRMRELLAPDAVELSAVARVPLNLGMRVARAGPEGPEGPEAAR